MVFQDQPIIVDDQGVTRFMQNRIVRYLLDRGPFDLNHIACVAGLDFSEDEQMQFAQLIGYSVCGYGELSYVSDEAYDRAEESAKDVGRRSSDRKDG